MHMHKLLKHLFKGSVMKHTSSHTHTKNISSCLRLAAEQKLVQTVHRLSQAGANESGFRIQEESMPECMFVSL